MGSLPTSRGSPRRDARLPIFIQYILLRRHDSYLFSQKPGHVLELGLHILVNQFERPQVGLHCRPLEALNADISGLSNQLGESRLTGSPPSNALPPYADPARIAQRQHVRTSIRHYERELSSKRGFWGRNPATKLCTVTVAIAAAHAAETGSPET